MKVFDCHTHIEQGRKGYDLEGVGRWNVIFNSIDEYKVNLHRLKSGDTATLIFDFQHAFDFISAEVEAGRIQGIKIHPRSQFLSQDQYPELARKLGSLKKIRSVVYDAFYYGDDWTHQPSLPHLIQLAKFLPQTNFIVGHCGGYEVLKYFFHLRTLKNIFYDLSFSLQYLSDTSCFPDLIKLIRYTDKGKIMFGSDYPWASAKFQFKILRGIFKQLRLTKSDQERILYRNADHVFRR